MRTPFLGLCGALLAILTLLAGELHAVGLPSDSWHYGEEGSGVSVSEMEVAANGSRWVAGGFSSTALHIGGLELERRGLGDAFVVRLGANGSASWATSIGGPGAHAYLAELEVTPDGQAFVLGGAGGASLESPALDLDAGRWTTFLAAYDEVGALLWVRSFQGQMAGTSPHAM